MRTASRRRSRHPSDNTVAEWALLESLLPVPAGQTKTGGRVPRLRAMAGPG